MAVLTILEHPDPRLRQRSAAVTSFDPDLARLVEELTATLAATSGIGLSAPQLGRLQRVFVMDLSERREAPQVFVNPEIVKKGRWGLVEESCLSVPGVTGNVLRATRVRARARTLAGEMVEHELEDMAAVCVQHEIDHLNGKLFVDRLPFWRRLRLRREMAGAGRSAAA